MDRAQSRREQILTAALECFVERGYGDANIAEIQKRSGASIGSIYHFFGGKDGIAVALFSHGLRQWSEASLAFDESAPAEDIVKASVRGTIAWALENPKLYRFMDETRFLAPIMAAGQDTQKIVPEARSRGEAVMARLVRTGSVRSLPWDVMHALILGPAHDWLRLQAHGLASSDIEAAATCLAAAAWDAVKARRCGTQNGASRDR